MGGKYKGRYSNFPNVMANADGHDTGIPRIRNGKVEEYDWKAKAWKPEGKRPQHEDSGLVF